MATSIASPVLPLQKQIPAYLYQQYADDADLQAFIDALNPIMQSYLDWSNQTSLAVYTLPAINGPLLDWIGQGIYGIQRPVFSTLAINYDSAAINANPLNTLAIDGSALSESGSAQTANDDYYKRTLTYLTYTGDGKYANLMTIRKRIARFLYGANGSDINVNLVQNVSIAVGTGNALAITLPAGEASSFFQQGYGEGFLVLPFMLDVTIDVA